MRRGQLGVHGSVLFKLYNGEEILHPLLCKLIGIQKYPVLAGSIYLERKTLKI